MPNSVGGSFFCQVHAEYAPLPAQEPVPESRFQGIQNVPFPTSSWTPKLYPSQAINPSQYNQPNQPSSYFQPSYGPKSYSQNVYPQATPQATPYIPTTLQQPSYSQSPHWLRPVYGQSQSPTVQYPPSRYRSLEINYAGYNNKPSQQPAGTHQPQQSVGVYQPQQSAGVYQPQQPAEYYSPQQPVYRPMSPQNQPQCQCGQRKRVYILKTIFFCEILV